MALVQVFKSERGKAEYLRLYQHTLKLWPVPYTEMDVKTSYGKTHVIVSGDPETFPLILLPGTATSASMWFPNVRALAGKYRVYAVDMLGDVGKSEPDQVPDTPLQWSEWLTEVFQTLGVKRAHVAGFSFGGWLTMVLALYQPDLVQKAVVLAPDGGLVSPRWQFFVKTLPATLIPSNILKRKSVLALAYQTEQIPERFIQQLTCAYQYKHCKLVPTVFTDEELQRLQVPVLLLVGKEEVVFHPEKAIKRAQMLIPNTTIRMVKDASHFLTMEQPGIVNGFMDAFLTT